VASNIGVIAQLAGGLGNQMFQYAAGRGVAARLGVELGLDVRPLRAPDSRAYALDAFAIHAELVPDQMLARVNNPRSWRWWVRKGWRHLLAGGMPRSPYSSFRPVVYQGVEYRDLLESAPAHSWLCGWWQSERYFATVASDIRRELTLRNPLPATRRMEASLRALPCPVAVHVRRGDYAAVASTRAYHGLCSPEYYAAAMARVRAERPDATFIFFSDDPQWVERELKPRREHLMTESGLERPEEDLHLMTCCRAHIIANSTFSWWGAWLADSPLVIAPARWFQAVEAEDIIPDRWLRV
jgi:hypothetical protein